VSRDAPPPLPGGYTVGDKVFFTGTSWTSSRGYKLVHGQQGEVTGPYTDENGEEGVAVLFPGNTGSIDCLLNLVRRRCAAPAPTPHPPLAPERARHILTRSALLHAHR